MLVGAVALPGSAASAKAKPPAETITCSALTATINFNPPLVPTPSSPGYSKKETTTITGETLSSCKESPTAGTVTAAASATATIPPGKTGNTCSGFAASAAKSKFTFVTTWNGTGGTSTAKFKGSTQTTSPPGFALSKGKVTGTYPTKTASVQANLNSAGTAAFAACDGGTGDISSLTISTGTATL
jgi:hypothetical protein